jgi:hypothetical protein
VGEQEQHGDEPVGRSVRDARIDGLVADVGLDSFVRDDGLIIRGTGSAVIRIAGEASCHRAKKQRHTKTDARACSAATSLRSVNGHLVSSRREDSCLALSARRAQCSRDAIEHQRTIAFWAHVCAQMCGLGPTGAQEILHTDANSRVEVAGPRCSLGS